MAFVPLHNHSDYSLLDGASQLPAMVERAKGLGMPALALTDHGVMYGAIELLKLCQGAGIKPIIGNEMYVINGSIDDPQPKKEKRYHLVVLAKNAIGYRNLVKLTSLSHLRGMRGRGIFSRACVDKHLLKKYSEGLIIATACLGGEIPQAILRGRPDVARDVASWYKEIFGDDFYLEIQDHGSPEDRIVNVGINKIGKELGIGLIATNDAHYLSKQDVEAHDALLCVLTGKLISDEKRLRYTGTEYIKTEDEMLRLFADHLDADTVRKAVENTVAVAEKVEDYDILGHYQMPRFPIPDGHDAVSYLKEVTDHGLRQRLELAADDVVDPVYAERLGVRVDDLLVSQPDTGEQALEIADMLVRSAAVDVIVVDSVAALTPKAEIEGEMGDTHVGLQARLMSQALRKLTANIKRSNTMVIFINQIRMKIGVMFGNPETTTGGNALKFYSSVRLDIRRIGAVKKGDEILGNQTRVKVVKNKVAPPFQKCEFDILYNEGISKEGELIDMGVEHKIVEKSGAWYSYNGERIGQGRDNVREFLREHADTAAEIENVVRQKMGLNNLGQPESAGEVSEPEPEAEAEAEA